MNHAYRRMASRIQVVAAIGVVATGASAFPPLPGFYSGTWHNITFNSTGGVKADVTIQGSTMTVLVDPGGMVFGLLDPAPFTLAGPLGPTGWSASVVGNSPFGDMQVNINVAGNVTVTGTNLPPGPVTSYSAMGTWIGGTSALAGMITLLSPPPATTTINTARTAFSTLVSANALANGEYGEAVGHLPDANGDGRGDVIVGAPEESPNGVSGGGRVYVYSGSTGSLLRTLVSPANESDGHFGASVAGVPDVNGDGRGDVVVGAPDEDPGASPNDCGRAYIFSGATGALLWKLIPPVQQAGAEFGGSVGGGPDVNGDGRGDVIVGAAKESPVGVPLQAGRAYIFSGATGVRLRTLGAPAPIPQEFFGFSVAALGDVNGDGRGDVIVGSPQGAEGSASTHFGRAFIFSGANGGLLRVLQSPAPEANGNFGDSVSGIADVNGDGRSDVVVGAFLEDPGASPSNCGRAYVYSGATGGLLWKLLPPAALSDGEFGDAVAGVPDVNGDGRGDVAVGASGENPGGFAKGGRVHLFSGATGVRLVTYISPYPEANGAFGAAVAGITDLNGNARGDLAVGAPRENHAGPTDAGKAYIIRK